MFTGATPVYEVLIIEDNAGDFKRVEEMIAAQMTANAHRAASFDEARELIEGGNTYSVVLLDLTLPDRTGEELIQDTLALCPDTPVIVLTDSTDFDFCIRSLAMGVADYLMKDELTGIALYKSIAYSAERKKISTALEASENRARSFAAQLNTVLEEERSRIAREIHDEFGQRLTGLKMSLTALKRSNPEGPARDAIIEGLLTEVNIGITSIRKIANELRPALLDKLGLLPALEWLATEFAKKTGIAAKCFFKHEPPELDRGAQINIFRICQEALNNTAKHSRATELTMRVDKVGNQWQLIIGDNGRGFAPNETGNALSMGLLNMQERAHLIGANLSVGRNFAGGTLIILTFSNYG